jgi:hypothetical protein
MLIAQRAKAALAQSHKENSNSPQSLNHERSTSRQYTEVSPVRLSSMLSAQSKFLVRLVTVTYASTAHAYRSKRGSLGNAIRLYEPISPLLPTRCGVRPKTRWRVFSFALSILLNASIRSNHTRSPLINSLYTYPFTHIT